MKFSIASRILQDYGVTLTQKKLSTPELQSINGREVSEFSAVHAAKELGIPVLKTDVSYCINALNGFPGPFVKFVNVWFTADDILKLMDGRKDRGVSIIEYLSYAKPDGGVITFKSVSKARLADKVVSSNGSVMDQLVIREGYDVPQNALSKDALDVMFRRDVKVWHELGKHLKQ